MTRALTWPSRVLKRVPNRVHGIAVLFGLFTALTLGTIVGCSGAPDVFGVEQPPAAAVADFDFTIPVGAGEALDAGTPLEILPARLDATVGQTIQIINQDTRGHLVGPWFVGAGETLRQTFASPGEFVGECSVHPSGQIKVVISA